MASRDQNPEADDPSQGSEVRRTPEKRRNRRRESLKQLAAAGTVVAGSQMLPREWVRPAVHAALVPVHALTTPPSCSLNGNWVLGDDGPGGLGGIDCGVTTVNQCFLYDDGTDMTLSVTVVPPRATTVTVDLNFNGTNGFGTGGDSELSFSTVTDPDTGVGVFGTWDPSLGPGANDDFGDSPGNGAVTWTFQAEGCEPCQIVLSISGCG